jgi:hypothetical protein
MPKPTDLTAAVQKCICDGIVAGMHLCPAAEACKVPAETATEWMRRGENRHRNREQNAQYAQFSAAIHEAEAQCERALVLYWRQQTPENWQAARDLLARRFPERWANREKIEHSGPEGKPIQFIEVARGNNGNSAE